MTTPMTVWRSIGSFIYQQKCKFVERGDPIPNRSFREWFERFNANQQD